MQGLIKKGFTLSEVLITLLIIGVIASLTIPTIIRNIQQKDTRTKVSKLYADLSQAFEVMAANQPNGTLINLTGGGYNVTPIALRNELTKYVKYTKLCDAPADCNLGLAAGMVLANGIAINFTSFYGPADMCGDGVMRYMGYINADLTGPNDNVNNGISDISPEWSFRFDEKGNLFPGIMCAPGKYNSGSITLDVPGYGDRGTYAVISGYNGYITPDY